MKTTDICRTGCASFGCALLALLHCTAFPAQDPQPDEGGTSKAWMELGGDLGYRSTNFGYDDADPKQLNYWILSGSVMAGLRFAFTENLFLDPYAKLSPIRDFGSRDWNNVFWNNKLDWGGGLRLRYEVKSAQGDEATKTRPATKGKGVGSSYFNLDLFAEYLYASDSALGDKDPMPEGVPTRDRRIGLSSWLTVRGDSLGSSGIRPWAEMRSEFVYHDTAFFEADHENYYLVTLAPRIGFTKTLSGVAWEPYVRAGLVRDLGGEDWNRQTWSNNVKYGAGLRIPLPVFNGDKGGSAYLYTEYLGVDYFSRVDGRDAGLASNDFRIGFNLWIPFGAVEGSEGSAPTTTR